MSRTITRDHDLEAQLKAALSGKYDEILPFDKSGGMGSVYLGQHRELKGWDLIKVLKPELASDPEYVNRFLREGRILKEIGRTCDQIPMIYDLHDRRELGLLFMTMQYIEGQSLAERIQQGPLDLDLVRTICRDILIALDEAHKRKIVHRDVKPANIVIDARGKVVLVDFGIAKELDKPGETRPELTIGTTEYMSPEQLMGQRLDARSDLYSFGCVLYECVTGKRLFPSDRTEGGIEDRFCLPDPIGKASIPNCPDHLAAVIRTLVARDPERRPESAREVMQQLGLEATTRRRLEWTRPRVVWAAGIVVAGLAVATIVGLDREPPPGEAPPARERATEAVDLSGTPRLPDQSGFDERGSNREPPDAPATHQPVIESGWGVSTQRQPELPGIDAAGHQPSGDEGPLVETFDPDPVVGDFRYHVRVIGRRGHRGGFMSVEGTDVLQTADQDFSGVLSSRTEGDTLWFTLTNSAQGYRHRQPVVVKLDGVVDVVFDMSRFANDW